MEIPEWVIEEKKACIKCNCHECKMQLQFIKIIEEFAKENGEMTQRLRRTGE